MRVLMVSDGIAPERVGGSYRYLRDLCKALSARGHECHVIVPQARKDAPLEEVGADGVAVHRVVDPPGPRLLGFAGRPRAIAGRVTALIEEVKPEALGVHWAYLASALPVARVPRICFFYGPWGAEFAARHGGHRPGIRLLAGAMTRCERRVVSGCAAAIVLSRYSAQQLGDLHGIPRDRIHVVPPGVDLAHFAPSPERQRVRRALGLPSAATLAVAVRRLDRRTGVDLLLRAVQAMDLPPQDLHLVIVGRGPDAARAQRLRCSLGLEDRVTLAGFVEESVLPQYYQAADVSVMPSIVLEGFGLATIESLACGTPVIGTRVGATPEILTQLSPNLVAEATPRALGARLGQFCRDQGGFPSRAACRQFAAERCAWDSAVAGVEGVLCRHAGRRADSVMFF
jgi:glycosyltransferase involved in cell wall biosynthesis